MFSFLALFFRQEEQSSIQIRLEENRTHDNDNIYSTTSGEEDIAPNQDCQREMDRAVLITRLLANSKTILPRKLVASLLK